MVDVTALVLDFIEQYGLLAIFILLILDASMLLPVFPAEVVLVIALAAYGDSPSDLILLIAMGSGASIIGSVMLYGIARGGGRALITRFPRFFMMPRKRREFLERVFARRIGEALVLMLRLFPYTRTVVSIPAGLARMRFVRYVVLSTIGIVVYHAAFLWFAYEVRRPGSQVDEQADQLRDAYADPAMEFVRTNSIITGSALLILGAILSIRASRQMLDDPEESTGSLIGTLAIAIFFWGGIALAVATYLDADAIYALMDAGGVDKAHLGDRPALGLFIIAASSIVVGLLLGRLKGYAKRHRRAHKRAKKLHKKRRKHAQKNPAVVGDAVPLEASRQVVVAADSDEAEGNGKK